MHHGDTRANGGAWTAEYGWLAVTEYFACIRRQRSGEHLHQRALASAIFANDGMNFARHEIHGDVIKGAHAGILHGDAAHPHTRQCGVCSRADFLGARQLHYAFLRKHVLRTNVPLPSRTSTSSALDVKRMFL